MRKGDLLRSIYAELRSSLGREVTAGEVIRLANLILRSYTGLEDFREDGRAGGPGRSLVCLAVDTAMRDGGWRVMEFEESQRSHDDDDGYLDAEIYSLIGTLLGPEWKHPSLAYLP
jgi:hypothetical protein